MKQNLFMLTIGSFLFSCNQTLDHWKQEVITTELNFCKMAQEKGVSEAFLAFADDHAVLMRNNNLIIGKEAMSDSFRKIKSTEGNISLTWKPEFVDVSSSGDLAYTYGNYTYTIKDSLGNSKEDKGVYHTVWKRQADENWKFVWD